MLNKRGNWMMEHLGQTVLILAVLIVSVLVFKELFGGTTGQARTLVDGTGDFDRDKIMNFNDDCPCEPGISAYKGCESQLSPDEIRKRQDDCALQMKNRQK